MTIVGEKTLCSFCQKVSSVLTCRGCGKGFCYCHVVEHRQELNKQMDEMSRNHDQLRQTIAEQEAQRNFHPLMKTIDEWEQQSIEKIRQAANDVFSLVPNYFINDAPTDIFLSNHWCYSD